MEFLQLYNHVTWPVSPKLTLTGAINFDGSPHDNEFYDTHKKLRTWSQQGGIKFRPTHSTTLRAIYLEGVQTHEKERLAPTHILGFPVLANNLRYTATSEIGLGIDQRMGPRTFARVTWFRRPEHIPYAYEQDDHSEFVGVYEGIDKGVTAAFERILSKRLTVAALYEFRHEDHMLVYHDERQGRCWYGHARHPVCRSSCARTTCFNAGPSRSSMRPIPDRFPSPSRPRT